MVVSGGVSPICDSRVKALQPPSDIAATREREGGLETARRGYAADGSILSLTPQRARVSAA